MSEPEVLVSVSGGVGRIVLNRPRVINALTLSMMHVLTDQLQAWMDDPSVERVELRGAGERGLCAGADVRALRDVVLAGGDPGVFLAAEYRLDGMIAEYPKPFAAHLTGIVMGGGLGLSAHASERTVYPDSRLAMPETIIGLEPDVGVLYELSHAPGELGTHLALTGQTVGAADAVLVGLADRCAGEAEPGVLQDARRWIDECYAADDASEIVARLESHPHPDAARAADLRRARSPLSVCVTLVAIRRAAAMAGVREVLAQDLLIVPRLAASSEFIEGVRAQLIDKDRTPNWRHARIEDVDPAEVAAVFAP